MTVVTPQYRQLNFENPSEQSGGKYESDNNLGVTGLSYHRVNVYFPVDFNGGEYGFYVFLKKQVNAMDLWKLEVQELGKVMETRQGRGSSVNFIYKTSMCTDNEDCGQNRICVFNQCIQDGTPRFTLLWEGKSTIDLSVKPPNGLVISRNSVYDAKSGGEFEGNLNDSDDSNHKRVQSVSFGRINLAIGGRYQVNVTNHGMTVGTPWTLNVTIYGLTNQSFTKTGNHSLSWNYDFAKFLVLPFNE
jgi:hypothetical protein